ncbi:MAG: gas vesicle protein GvpG [Terriglobales bacterium]
MLFIDDLLFAPVTGFKFILNTLARVAEEQYTDDAPVKQQLLELQVELDEGQITEDEYIAQEAAILRQLRDIENRKREMAGLETEERQPLSGKVAEGSGASVTIEHHNTYGQ